MTSKLPTIRLRQLAAPLAAVPRRSFLRYTGASAALGSLWLAGCTKKDDVTPTPAPQAAPVVTSFSPASGMPGATVTLSGTGFTGATAVLLGSSTTTFTVASDTTITLTVPAGAQTGAITVTTPAGTVKTSSAFTVTAAPVAAPTITGFTPASALPGATVTVTGTNFTGATALTVGGVAAAPTVVSATSLTFVVPATAQPGVATVVVTTPSGTGTNSTAFMVLASTVSVGTGDVGVLNYAYALEQLEAAFYTQVRAGAYYLNSASSAEKLVLDDLYYHEVIHRDFFKTALMGAGVTPLKDLTVDFSGIDFSQRTAASGSAKLGVFDAAQAFEDLGVAAYIGVAQFITSTDYLLLAAKISSVEARHAAVIRDLVAEGTFVGGDIVSPSTSLEIAKLPSVVAVAANAFLAPGSKLDVSGLG